MTSPFIQQIADNRVCQVLTCLPEKFVVDFANGIDVAQEHIWNLYTLNNGGAFMAPEPDDDDDETWVLFNAMNGNRAEMSPEAAGIAACLMTYSHHACRTENYAMTVHYYRLRDYALQHPECSAIMRIID